MMTHTLKGTWRLLALTPLLVFLGRGLGPRTIASGLLYVFGWLMLRVALARDPNGQALKSFGQSTVARVLGVGVLLLFQVVGLAVSGEVALDLLLVLAAGFFLLWAVCRTGEALTKAVENFLTLTAAVALFLIVGEIFFRLPLMVARTGGNTPGIERWAQKHYDYLWKGHPLDVRSLHLDKAKPAGAFRVLTLGDSRTWGDKIPRTQNVWPFVLERLLQRQDRPLQVVNLAVCGFTTVNEAEMLEREGWSYKPDLIILQFYINDTLPSGPNFSRKGEEWHFRTRPLLPVLHPTLDGHSYFYSYLNARFGLWQVKRFYPDGYAPLFADNFAGWQACKDAIRRMAEQAQQRNVPMMMVLFPAFEPSSKMDDASYPHVGIYRKVKAAAEGMGLPVLDVRPAYARFGRIGRTWWALPCDPHPNVEAHRIIAQTIDEKLKALGWIPSVSAGKTTPQ
jgi:lysophospholipase L1-like esterase